MGLFRGKEKSPPARSLEEKLIAVGDLNLPSEFPSATPDQMRYMSELWVSVVDNMDTGAFEPRQVAALTTLTARLADENQDLARFGAKLRRVASEESLRRPSEVSWSILAQRL